MLLDTCYFRTSRSRRYFRALSAGMCPAVEIGACAGVAVMEKWRQIPGYEGVYEISDLGRVRTVHKRARWPAAVKTPTVNRDGYLRVGLTINGKERKWFVHRLVLMAFVGPRPLGAEANHKSGNKLDNSLDNLEWVTPTENQKHAYRTGLRERCLGDKNGRRTKPDSTCRGEQHRWAKLTEDIVRRARVLSESGMGPTQIKEQLSLDCTIQAIHGAVNRKSWRWLDMKGPKDECTT